MNRLDSFPIQAEIMVPKILLVKLRFILPSRSSSRHKELKRAKLKRHLSKKKTHSKSFESQNWQNLRGRNQMRKI